jgi:hypothetical protein
MCLYLKHVGEQDKSIPAIWICLARKPTPKPADLDEWIFSVSRKTFNMFCRYVFEARSKFPSRHSDGVIAYGTFEISWSIEGKQSGNYTIPPDAACDYLNCFTKIAQKAQNAELAQVLVTLMGRLRCPDVSEH